MGSPGAGWLKFRAVDVIAQGTKANVTVEHMFTLPGTWMSSTFADLRYMDEYGNNLNYLTMGFDGTYYKSFIRCGTLGTHTKLYMYFGNGTATAPANYGTGSAYGGLVFDFYTDLS